MLRSLLIFSSFAFTMTGANACVRSLIQVTAPESRVIALPPLIFPHLQDHALGAAAETRAVLPAAALIKMAFESLASVYPVNSETSFELAPFRGLSPVPLPKDAATKLTITVEPKPSNYVIKITNDAGTKVAQGTGTAVIYPNHLPAFSEPIGGTSIMTAPSLYARLRRAGYAYGPTFQRLKLVTVSDNRAAGSIEISPSLAASDSLIDETVLDSCFHLFGAIFFNAHADGLNHEIFVPFTFGTILFSPNSLAQRPREFRCEMITQKIPQHADAKVVFDLRLSLPNNTPVLSIRGGTAIKVPLESFGK